MKKILLLLSLTAFVCAGTAAFAEDSTAALYKSRCAGCHGADGTKSTGGSPPIKGMSSSDIETKLHGYVDGTYGGKLKNMMINLSKKLSDDEVKALADYISKF